jgi:small-conductance mechanosensitive channel
VEASIVAGQKAVAAAIVHIDRRLWQIDSPPIWELWRHPPSTDNALRSVQSGLAVEMRFLEEYSTANRHTRQLNNAIALAILPLLVWLSYRSRKVVTDDPEIQASARVLLRPISSWLVLVLVGVLVLEPDAPALLHQAVLLAALIPVLRLLPREVFAVLGPWPYVATGLYLLDHLRFLFLDNPLHYRLYLVALTLLTLGLLVWLLLRFRRRVPGTERRVAHKVIHVAGWLAVALLMVSVVAAVVGNVSLAEMLTEGLLESGYVGLVLYAGVTVLASVLRLLLARRAVSRFRVVTQHAGPLLRSTTRLLRVAAAAAWVAITLNEFRVFRPIFETVRAVLVYPLTFGKISLTLGSVLLFAFSVYLAFWVAKAVRYLLRDEILPKMSLPRGVGNSVSSLTYYALVLIGLMVALAAAGFEASQFALVFGALGVGIGFGLQNVVNNFVSGLILMFERPIQPGDVVEITGTSGKVREIGMRATTLTTFEGADVVVPNGTLLSEKLINWTLSDMDRRIDVNIGVAYGNDPRKVMDLLLEVTKATPGVAEDPEPAVVFAGFSPSALDFGIRAWTNQFGEWVTIRSELSVRVYDALKAAGIEIPFPQQVVHLRSEPARTGAAMPSPATPSDG